MEKINNLINSMTEPFILIGDFAIRIGLGVSFSSWLWKASNKSGLY